MPIYEYECSKCHHKLDLMQKMSDPPAHQCPQCLEDSLVRLISAAGFQLKGEGWYATDFKNKNTHSHKTNSSHESEAPPAPVTDKQSTDNPSTKAASSATTKKKQEGDSN